MGRRTKGKGRCPAGASLTNAAAVVLPLALGCVGDAASRSGLFDAARLLSAVASIAFCLSPPGPHSIVLR